MSNILLIEPGYSNKYPPLGLMKISYFHKEIRNDIVHFAKGTLKDDNKLEIWDRIYVTTLFTFEWKEIENTIDYAISLVDNPNKVYVGGIAATLLTDYISKVKPGINVIKGLLNQKGKLGYNNDDIIDQLPPDYSILRCIEYQYPTENAYFAYTTRGCGMNCSFCAVKTLEPNYIPRVSIKEQVDKVNKLYKEKKDLVLMDNNVLKSSFFEDIVNEIMQLGFKKGDKYYNPDTKNHVKRAVDFNQGLDANLITKQKAKLLAQLELRPVRIAFDHVQDKETYISAVKLCVAAGLREFSNYVLYNSDESSGKGKEYPPDSPEELFIRLQINVQLQQELSQEKDKVSIYSFPMRYIPLNALNRGYIGPNWNAKYLRAIQVMLAPTQGKGVGGITFFEADFGTTIEEFKTNLIMPERIIGSRGHFPKYKKNETPEEKEYRKESWSLGRELLESWKELFTSFSETEREEFNECIKDNQFNKDKFKKLSSRKQKKLYLYYFTRFQLFNLFETLDTEEDIELVQNYCKKECPAMIRDFVRHINKTTPPFNKLIGYFKLFGDFGIVNYLKKLSVPGRYRQIGDDQILLDQMSFWEDDFEYLDDKIGFTSRIKNNSIGIDTFNTMFNKQEKRTFVHYLSESQLLELLLNTNNEKDLFLISEYFINDAPSMIQGLSRYVVNRSKTSNLNLVGYLRAFGNAGISILLKTWLKERCIGDTLLKVLEKGFNQIRRYSIDIRTWQLFQDYLDLEVLSEEEKSFISSLLFCKQHGKVLIQLCNLFPRFKDKYLEKMPSDATSMFWKEKVDRELVIYYSNNFQSLFNNNE